MGDARSRLGADMSSLPLFVPKADWTPPKEPPNLDGVTVLAIDIEARDPELLESGPGFIRGISEITGVSLATVDSGWYFPINHPEDNCAWDAKSWLRDTLSERRTYIFCNAPYDVEALWSMAAVPEGRWVDIQVLQALIDEEFAPGYSLDAISNYWVGAGKDTETLDKALAAYGFIDRGGIGYLPARFVGEYATMDAVRTMQSYLKQVPYIEADNLGAVQELEENLMPLTWQMRLNGVRFHRSRAEELRHRFTGEASSITNTIMKDYGVVIEARSSKALARYCDREGIRYPITAKGNPSFTADFLSGHKSPVLSGVSKVRRLEKMVNDFIDPWLMYSARTGRIHPQWLLTASEEGGTRSGRLASKNPNMQQVPVRDPELGPLMRGLFLPNEGERWGKFDVNSQEIRIAVHYAIEIGCRGVDGIHQAYLKDPRLDFHQMVANMAGVDRTSAKTISLGSLYGLQKKGLAQKLGFSEAHADMVYSKYHEVAPYFAELSDKVMKVAEERGYVRTMLGRRRRFSNHSYLHKALNAVVQGTAADMIKQAMLNIWNEYQQIALLTVHDELAYSVGGDSPHIAKAIENALTFRIPMVVDPLLGDSWHVGK
jgi:DNA polymerase I-like protein with 3'-5' exonuclease and polymerase domains